MIRLLTIGHLVGSIVGEWLGHAAGAICLALAIAAWAAARLPKRRGTETAHRQRADRAPDLASNEDVPTRAHSWQLAAATFQIASLLAGGLVIAVLCHKIGVELVRRLLGPAGHDLRPSDAAVTVSGLAGWTMVAAATVIGIAATAGRQHPSGALGPGASHARERLAHAGARGLATALFWVLAVGGVWLALLVAPSDDARRSWWSIAVMVALTAVGAGFTFAQGMIRQYRRKGAWPDRLWQLTGAHPDWPGFRASAGAMGVAVLALGCLNISSPATVGCAALMAGCLLRLAHRRWNENLADLGMLLATLTVCAAAVFVAPRDTDGPSQSFPGLLSAVLVGLAVMTFIWHWLPRVWDQQLLDGQAWTTAGRMIPGAKRMGLIVGALGVVTSIQLALWPVLSAVETRGDTTGRWAAGLGANGALLAALVWSAIKTRTRSRWVLVVLAGAGAALFAAVRSGLWPH